MSESTDIIIGTRNLSGLMGEAGPFYLDATTVRAVECNADRTVSILMDDGRCYVSTDDVGVVLLSLGGKRPERACRLVADGTI